MTFVVNSSRVSCNVSQFRRHLLFAPLPVRIVRLPGHPLVFLSTELARLHWFTITMDTANMKAVIPRFVMRERPRAVWARYHVQAKHIVVVFQLLTTRQVHIIGVNTREILAPANGAFHIIRFGAFWVHLHFDRLFCRVVVLRLVCRTSCRLVTLLTGLRMRVEVVT